MTELAANERPDAARLAAATLMRGDRAEGMSYLETLSRRLITLYLPLAIILVVLLFPFYWMALTAIKPDEQLLDLEKFNPGPRRRPSSTSSSSCSRAPIRIGCGTP